MMSGKESQKASLWVQYFAHLKLVDESDVLHVSMEAHDIVWGLPWRETRKFTGVRPSDSHMNSKLAITGEDSRTTSDNSSARSQ
jgi:hypothetical protein